MATNVTRRNEVLRELLRWHLEKERLAANRLFDGVTPPRQADVVCGKLRAHTESSNHILSMLGYPDALLHARLSGRLATGWEVSR